MQVRMLKAVDYTAPPGASPRCYGWLRFRASEVTKETPQADGKILLEKVCGPMVSYFPAGAKPELPDDVARQFIEAGAAVGIDGQSVRFVSLEDLREMTKVE